MDTNKKKIRFLGIPLSEIIIICSIITILAAVAIPQYANYTDRVIVNSGKSSAISYQKAIEAYYDEHGVLPKTGSNLIAYVDALKKQSHDSIIELSSDGEIVITFIHNKKTESYDLAGKTLVLVPILTQGVISWDECIKGSLPQRVRGYKCQQREAQMN